MLTEQQQQQQQHSGLANRSFLYRSSGSQTNNNNSSSSSSSSQPTTNTSTLKSSDSCLIGGTIVYATLDSVALRASLPLPLTLQHQLSTQLKLDHLEKSSESVVSEVQPASSVKLRNVGYTFPGDKKPSNKKNKDNERFAFAKNVLHYVPVQSRRYYRKSRNLASKSLSLRSLATGQQQQQQPPRKCRSLSRDISISKPSNFVHVDSGSRYLDVVPPPPPPPPPLLVDASRTGSQYAEISLDNNIFLLNPSFVWQQLTKLKEAQHDKQQDDADYDDVGPPIIDTTRTSSETQECKAAEIANAELVEELDEEQEMYDDVGPALVLQEQVDEKEKIVDSEYEVYDDVGPLRPSQSDNEEQRIYEIAQVENKANETLDEDEVYDDVGPVYECNQLRLQLQQNHERVNSLYAGLVQFTYDQPHQDSEWEDLDEPKQATSHPKKATSNESSCKKKLANGPRWSCKIRRQRSKASRNSSARSTSRNSRSSRLPHANHLTRLEHDSSDDSNYETLQTYEPDDFSSSSSSSSSSSDVNDDDDEVQRTTASLQPAPSRPVPPPPREESLSLSHSLGRRMKMLRRTWSITKGSLGRMRRRASGEMSDYNQPTPPPAAAAHYDPRKYFSFKKAFGKSSRGQGQGSSTFYLDKSLSSEGGSSNENEPIYSNADWYKEVGLYDCSQRLQQQQQQPITDHYSVLTEEPLYQFYAANATRVAFESDSDGYEEVEELTPSSATTDLARPGHRTLWCQTPQVINSGLLQRLTMEERKIQEAKFEIVTSEASYLNSLRVLENEFASNYELAHEILTGAERDKLFGGVPDVLVASERFLAELEGIWREDPMLGKLAELLLKHADKCASIYVEYCSNQVDVDATLKDLKAKKGYRYLEVLSRIETQPACQSLSLHSFLMLPMQRITRLPLLADAVLSKLAVEHSERLSWERVLAELSQIVARCNEAARLAERRNEMDALARKLEYPAKVPPVELRDRELIRSGTVVQLSAKSDTEYKLTFGKKLHKTPLMLMLLTDYLLVAKLKSNSNEETYSVIETCKRSLVALESAPEDGGPLSGRHAMLLTLLENHAGRQVELVISCENDTEKKRWMDAVSPPKPTLIGETLYESWDCPQVMAVYSYSARQPDEIALQPGDVINVLRKMNDGWLFGEKLLDGEQGWFPGNFTKEVASEHVRARNLRQRHRFLALSGSVLQRKAKQSLSLL